MQPQHVIACVAAGLMVWVFLGLVAGRFATLQERISRMPRVRNSRE